MKRRGVGLSRTRRRSIREGVDTILGVILPQVRAYKGR